MKKFVCLCVAMTFLLSVFSMNANAVQVGDVIGEVVYTDISAYINHYPISAYAYDGGMVIVAEDLSNYGFEVTYDDSSRSLSIVPNRTMTTLTGMGTVYKNGNRLGEHFADALYSDINVYFNGSLIPSCAINGYTMVKLEDLVDEDAVTSFTWDNSTRSAKLWIDWAGITEYKELLEAEVLVSNDTTSQLSYYSEVPWCPDFGALIGKQPVESQPVDNDDLYGYIYIYSVIGSNPQSIKEYGDILEQLGYIGIPYQGNIMFFKGDYAVTISYENTYFFVMATISK